MPDMSPKEIAREIARSPDVLQEFGAIANQITESATQAADSIVGDEHSDAPYFGSDVTNTPDGVRAHVWAANGPAIHAERKAGVLVDAAASYGQFRKDGRQSRGVMKARQGLK